MPRLIVNADDFGLTSGVNRGILELHQAGLVTSTTLMARAAATEEAIEIARSTPTLAVGCHIVLVDGDPILSAAEHIPNLADPALARFQTSLPAFLNATYRASPAQKISSQIEAEATAQIRSLQSGGLRLTHVDTHKHTHMFPRVLRAVLRAARACGIRAVRNPFEPVWAIRATTGAGLLRAAEVALLHLLQSTWKRILAEEGFSTTSGTLAVAGTGFLDAGNLRRLIEPLRAGTWELVTHPGYNDADLDRVRTRLRASRDAERQALAILKQFPSLDLINFANLDAGS